ncbi:hypothetical protein [Blastococcus sp. CT_GayMR16]|uniref:hypothetical protein n=1 Tax=Blastococcus sp. CT_GayMR16 TaxID=2559607 RepID=UPI0010742503|nr:hypothetical protein [Blastococcus sp. CT_GayMR16]TFV83161.1 hypothetical protein E4P38_21125 [Blastococcus sp. CT_GayMR16]
MTPPKVKKANASAGQRPPTQDHQAKRDPHAAQRLRIGGRSRVLRFDGNAMIEACALTGLEDIEAVMEAASRLNPRVIRAVVWAGLLHEGDPLELEEVGALLGDGKSGSASWKDAMMAGIAAISSALGVDSAELADAVVRAQAGEDPTKRGAGTGTTPSTPRSEPGSATPSSGA